MATTMSRTTYHLRGDSIESCSCNHGCNCQFGGFPNEGICEFVIGYDVTDGRVGDVDITGVRIVVAGKYPNALHEGNGHVVMFVDESASDEQVNAVLSVFSGQLGGMPWEALAPTIAKFEGPVRAHIDMEVSGKRSRVRVGRDIEVLTTPLLNPVTGAEQNVHIAYPDGGFFWNDGDIVTTETMRAKHGDLELEWPSRFAAIAPVAWSNAT
ncbi:MAG TPA: DUF1326 domain-containing protein [Longimicrobiales bacterium]|nr:DUF1326 domain-containing protein [Longimicrobiales bacterium]